MTLEFHIPWTVEPKQSMRHRIIVDGTGRRYIASYTPAKVKANSQTIASLVAQHRPRDPLSGPLRATYVLTYPWRSSTSQRARKAGPMPKDTKPDCDNLGKNLSDTLQRSGFFANDSQIADLRIVKQWGDQAGVTVRLEGIQKG